MLPVPGEQAGRFGQESLSHYRSPRSAWTRPRRGLPHFPSTQTPRRRAYPRRLNGILVAGHGTTCSNSCRNRDDRYRASRAKAQHRRPISSGRPSLGEGPVAARKASRRPIGSSAMSGEQRGQESANRNRTEQKPARRRHLGHAAVAARGQWDRPPGRQRRVRLRQMCPWLTTIPTCSRCVQICCTSVAIVSPRRRAGQRH